MKRRLVLAATLAASLALTGCASSAAPSSQPTGASTSLRGASITVYNAQSEALTQAWADAFSKESGVQVTLRNGDDSELGNQLVQEGAASPADVFLTENSPAMSLVDNAGLFTKVDASTVAQVPAGYRPTTGTWTGIAARSTVMVYNPSKIAADQLPKSILELQNPEWKGRWSVSPSGADFQAIVAALLAKEGKDKTLAWLKGVKDNATAYKGNSTVMKAVNAGESPLGVIYHYYWYADQAGTKENSANTKLASFTAQDAGAFVSVSGGGVLKSSKNQAAGQAFLKFITGKAGQDILRTGTSFEYPVASGVSPNPVLPALGTLGAPEIDPATLDSTAVVDLMTQAGLI